MRFLGNSIKVRSTGEGAYIHIITFIGLYLFMITFMILEYAKAAMKAYFGCQL